MNRLVSSEALKVRSLRSTRWVGAAALALSAVIGVAMVKITADQPAGPDAVPRFSAVALGPVQAMWFVVIGLAIVAAAGEFQHRTIRSTLLVAPRRGPVLLAKATVCAALGFGVVLAGSIVATAAGVVTARMTGVSVPAGGVRDWVPVVVAAGLGALWAVLASALGLLTRSVAVAITTLLLWRFVGEGLVPVMTGHPGVSAWTPTGAGNALVGLGGADLLPVWAAVVVFLGYVVAVTGAAGWRFDRTDPA